MPFLDFSNISIAGLAGAVPAHIQYRDMDRDSRRAKMFLKQTGIKQRHISLIGQTNMDLCYVASKKILEKMDWDVKSLDAIISITQTPDFAAPGDAHLLQYRLGMREDVMVLDTVIGCSAFPFGLATCASLLQNPNIKRLLMVCGDSCWYQYPSLETISSDNIFIHGEGSVALLLEKQEYASPIQINLHADGSGYKYLFAPFGSGVRNAHRHWDPAILPDGAMHSGRGRYMDGMEITSFATTTVVKSIQDFLIQTKKSFDDFDGLVLHQANIQIVTTMADRLGLTMDKVPVSLDRYGNTDGATIPITMIDAYAESSKETLSLLTSGFGIGLSWGIASIEIKPSVIEPMIYAEGDVFEEVLVRHPE